MSLGRPVGLLMASLVALVSFDPAIAKGGHSSGSTAPHQSPSAGVPHGPAHPPHAYGGHLESGHSIAPVAEPYAGVKRDQHGKIARDPHAKEAFRKTHPCPSTGKTYGACPGWTVDHVQALKHGGADDPSNMQWQTAAEAKAKDRWE